MRILHVLPTLSPIYGGPPKACMDMAGIMAKRGHDVELYTINYDGLGEFNSDASGEIRVIDGVKVTQFKIGLLKYRFFSPDLFRALCRNISSFDLVHIHEPYVFPSIAGGFCCRLKNIPYVFQPHGSLDPYVKRRRRWRKALFEFLFVRPLVTHAAVVHYTTTEEMQLASPYTFGRPGTVIPLGIHLDEYRPLPERGSFRARHPELAGRTLVLFLGRINPSKGLDVLARAFGRAARLRDDLHLVVAGPDNSGYQQQVETWLREDGVDDRATFTGMITGEEKLAALRDADLFALTSYSESFGLSVVEAMACKVPVLVSDKVKIWRDVVSSGAGRVAPLDPERVAEIMVEMVADEAERERAGWRGVEAVRTKFNWAVIAEDLERHYYAVLGDEPPAPSIKKPVKEAKRSVAMG